MDDVMVIILWLAFALAISTIGTIIVYLVLLILH